MKYYSETLDKVFDSVKELTVAENEAKSKEDKKKAEIDAAKAKLDAATLAYKKAMEKCDNTFDDYVKAKREYEKACGVDSYNTLFELFF